MAYQRPIKVIFVCSIGIWLVAVTALYGWLLAIVLPDPGSHEAADAILGAIVLSPLIPIELLGLAAIAGLWRGWRSTPYLAIGWGIVQSLVALLALAAPSGDSAVLMGLLTLCAFVGLFAGIGLLPGILPRLYLTPRRAVSAGRPRRGDPPAGARP